MRRLLSHLLAAYAGAVAVTVELERRGVLHCTCGTGCWCRRPGLRQLRWALPLPHRGC